MSDEGARLNAPDRPPAGPRAQGVAVLIAAYNAEATVGRAVASALRQPEAQQVVVIDDASGDRTAERARAFDDGTGRLQVLQHSTNLGPAAARNRGLEVSTSPWITVLDADDYYLEGRLGRLLALAAGLDMVGDALIRMDAGEEPATLTGDIQTWPLDLETFARGNLGRQKGPLDLGFLKPLLRREALDRASLRYNPRMRLGEDYDLYAHLLASGGKAILTGPAGYVSVRTPASLSQRHGLEDLRQLRDCDRDLERAARRSRGERAALRARRRGVERRLQWRRLIEAVKARRPAEALSTFESLHVSLYLLGQLLQQLWLRGGRKLGLSTVEP